MTGNYGRYKKGTIVPECWETILCKQCHVPFKKHKCIKNKKFCSMECYGRYRSYNHLEFSGYKKGHSWLPKESPKEIGIKGLIKQQNSKDPTSIEKIVYQKLKDLGIVYETQKLINGKFLVDAYLPDHNIVIEVDGSYWHSLDRVVKKDKAENAYLKKCGYRVIRISEEEIKKDKFLEGGVTLN